MKLQPLHYGFINGQLVQLLCLQFFQAAVGKLHGQLQLLRL